MGPSWGRRALTQACEDIVKTSLEAILPFFQDSLSPSSLLPAFTTLPTLFWGLCLIHLGGRWLMLSPVQRGDSGWNRSDCPESCPWPQEMLPHGRAHLHLGSEPQRGTVDSLPSCHSTAPWVLGTSHLQSTALGSHQPQVPSCEHEVQSPTLRREGMGLRPGVLGAQESLRLKAKMPSLDW